MALDWRKARDSKLLEKGKLLHQETKDRWKALKKKKRPHVAQAPKVKPNLKPRSNDEYVFEDILNSIGSKEYMRDKKLEQILGEDKEVKTEEKKKWLW